MHQPAWQGATGSHVATGIAAWHFKHRERTRSLAGLATKQRDGLVSTIVPPGETLGWVLLRKKCPRVVVYLM